MQFPKAFADFDPTHAIFPHHAFPEGVVAIEDQDLGRRGLEGVDKPSKLQAKRCEEAGGVGHVAQAIPLGIVKRRRLPRLCPRHGQDAQVGKMDNSCDQLIFQLSKPLLYFLAGRHRGQRRANGNNERSRHGCGCASQGRNEIRDVALGLVAVGENIADPAVRTAKPVFAADQHDIDAVAIAPEEARGVEQLLKHLAVGRDLGAQRKPGLLQEKIERVEQWIDGKGAGEYDAARDRRIRTN